MAKMQKKSSSPEILSQGQCKMKGAAKTVTPPSDESNEAKVKEETVLGEHPEVERINPSHSVQSNSDKRSGDDDALTGIDYISEAASAVASLSGPAKTIFSAPATALKKIKAKKPAPAKRKLPATKAKKPAPPSSDDKVFWLRFSDFCRYKADHDTPSVPRSKGDTDDVLANWIQYTRKRYRNNAMPTTYNSTMNGVNFELTAGQITKKGWFAELQEFHKQNGTVQVLGENQKKPACQMGKLYQENSHRSVDEQENKCRVYCSIMQDTC
jgi:hypothetical protein